MKLSGYRKGQAAMEFLMTYGWAILIVLIAIALLAFFGVLKPGALLPERCSFPSGYTCTDHSVTDSYVSIILQSAVGRSMHIRGVTVTGEALGAGNLCTTVVAGGAPGLLDDCPVSAGLGVNGCIGGPTLENGATMTITMASGSCTYVDTGRDQNRYNVTLYYNWVDSLGTPPHEVDGELLARKA